MPEQRQYTRRGMVISTAEVIASVLTGTYFEQKKEGIKQEIRQIPEVHNYWEAQDLHSKATEKKERLTEIHNKMGEVRGRHFLEGKFNDTYRQMRKDRRTARNAMDSYDQQHPDFMKLRHQSITCSGGIILSFMGFVNGIYRIFRPAQSQAETTQ